MVIYRILVAPLYPEQHFAQDLGQFFGSSGTSCLQPEKGTDFAGLPYQGQNEMGIIHPIMACHKVIEVQREVFLGGVEDDAYSRGGDLF